MAMVAQNHLCQCSVLSKAPPGRTVSMIHCESLIAIRQSRPRYFSSWASPVLSLAILIVVNQGPTSRESDSKLY